MCKQRILCHLRVAFLVIEFDDACILLAVGLRCGLLKPARGLELVAAFRSGNPTINQDKRQGQRDQRMACS